MPRTIKYSGSLRPGGRVLVPESPIGEGEKHRDEEEKRQQAPGEGINAQGKRLIYEEDNAAKGQTEKQGGRFIRSPSRL